MAWLQHVSTTFIQHHKTRALAPYCFSALLLSASTLAVAEQSIAIEQQLEQSQRFNIAPQPLANALLEFAQQSGLQIIVDNALVNGLHSSGLQIEQQRSQALTELLSGTDLRWRISAGNSLTLEVSPELTHTPLQTPDMVVTAAEPLKQGSTTLDRKFIERMPAGNGDITSLLKIHPNVQFDNKQMSSKTPGEISPADISINGARPWQNLFMLDGLNMNNDIDPGSATNDADEVPGRSQGLAIDTDLLSSINVLDSNVPASYGGFNGGVVEAQTRQPTQELHGKISSQMTRSSWTRYHIDDNDPNLDEFEAGFGSGNQPEFSKLITRVSLEGHLSESFGLLGSFSRKHATIPTRNFGLGHTTSQATDTHDSIRQIDNYFLKGVWQINETWDMDVSLTHAPELNRGYVSNSIDSQYQLKQGGDSLSTRLRWAAPWAKIEQTFNWSELSNSRESETDYMVLWRNATDKDWSSTAYANQGGHGGIEQKQDSLGYKLVADWNSFATFGVEHSWQTGLELQRQDFYYERSEPHYSYATANLSGRPCNGAPLCAPGKTLNNWNGQYANSMTLTEGKIGFSTDSWAAFIQDEMRYQRLTLRPGVRVDSDDYMDKTTIAPRLAANFDVFGNAQTNISAGANRYYGRNLATYRLRDGVASLSSNYTRTAPDKDWIKQKTAVNGAKFNQLDIPYNDELMLAFSQVAWDTEFSLKYVNRKGRDLISRAWGSQIGQPSPDTSLLASNYYTYYNGGQSNADVYSLTITPLKDLMTFGQPTQLQLILDWTEVVSSGLSDYTSNIGALYVNDPVILYEDQFMRYSERPADNYNRPWTARLNTSTQIHPLNLTWTNFLRYRAGYTRMAATGKTTPYDGTTARIWAETDYAAALTWDTRLAWEQPLPGKQAVFVNLDVTNVLDEVSVSEADSNQVPLYEIGRQFMLEVGYRF